MAAPRATDLAAIEQAVWTELVAAVNNREHAWRHAVLATATEADGVDARTIVLREASRDARTLTFFTDERSPKVRHIVARPEGKLVLWSGQLGWQLRLSARLEVETAGLAVSSRWARLKMTPGAHDYLSPLPPGSTVEHPAPVRGTREYFAVVTAHVLAIDWLELHAEGHRRACFDGGGRRWLAP